MKYGHAGQILIADHRRRYFKSGRQRHVCSISDGTNLLHDVCSFFFLLAINTAYMEFVEATYTSEGRRIDAVCSEIMLKLLLDLGLWLEGFCTKSPQTGQVLEAMVEVWAFQSSFGQEYQLQLHRPTNLQKHMLRKLPKLVLRFFCRNEALDLSLRSTSFLWGTCC